MASAKIRDGLDPTEVVGLTVVEMCSELGGEVGWLAKEEKLRMALGASFWW